MTPVIGGRAGNRYPVLMTKKISFAALALTLAASAHAALPAPQIVQLPARMPAMPASAPSPFASQPLALPSISIGQPRSLPSISGLPKIAPGLPSLPQPLITLPGQPAVNLPGPANPMPVARKAVVKIAAVTGSFAMKFAPSKPVETAVDAEEAAEKLGRLFDGAPAEELDEVRHTLPETDLLNEIGVL